MNERITDERYQSKGSHDRSMAHVLLRLSLGTTIFLHGIVRLISGIGRFADDMVQQFASTPLPSALIRGFGSCLPFLEALIGLFLILGFCLRWTLIGGALLMSALIFGSTLRSDFQIVGLQLIYAVIYFLLLFTLEYDCYSLDRMRRGRRVPR